MTWESEEELFVHHTCKLNIASKKRLGQAERRKEISNLNDCVVDMETESCITDEVESNRRWTRSSGPIHKPHLFLKPKDNRHKDRNKSVLHLIEYESSWLQFKSHTIHLEDPVMRSRLVTFIYTSNDPFATEIRYHPNCWRKYITYSERNIFFGIYLITRYKEVKIIMVNHIEDTIFVRNELRTLVSLLHDYNQLLRNFNFKPIERTSTLKTMMEAEFGETVGFYQGIQKNQSWTIYDKTESDTLLDAALFSFGISDDLLFKNTAKWLRSKLKGSNDIDWPPSPMSMHLYWKLKMKIQVYFIDASIGRFSHPGGIYVNN